MIDHTLEYMKKKGVPLTRENYLDYAYLGSRPEVLDAEEEYNLPEEFQINPPENFE
jgi:hypothetical protein